MDEIIVRVARALACLTRLRILSYLARKKEVMPSVLARDLGIGLDAVCMHLRRLSDAGLVLRRRSGARCYCLAESAYGEDALSGKMSQWIRRLLEDPAQAMRNYGVDQLRNSSSGPIAGSASRMDSPAAQGALHRLLFEAMTAFTNVRRLQIVRRLSTGKPLTVDALMAQLHMSDAAVSRHMKKLLRRGYVRAARENQRLVYRLSGDHKTAVHRELYEMVASSLRKGKLRS